MTEASFHRHSPTIRPHRGGRRKRSFKISWAVLVLLLVNITVFFVQHLTLSGYQKLVPIEAQGKADRIAEKLRSLDEPSLARSLERKLHIIGEIEHLTEDVEERTFDQEAKVSALENLESTNPTEFAQAESRLAALKNVGSEVAALRGLLGSNHEAGGVSLQDLREGRFWTLLTHLFVHGSTLHLGLNMIVLASAGTFAALSMGPRHFLAIFFVGGLVGAALQISFFPNVYLIGASAGVYAVTIASLLLLPEDSFYRFRIPLRPRFVAIGVTVVALAMLAWTLMSSTNEIGFIERVAHLAHLGGIMVGWYYVKMLGIGPREPVPRYFEPRVESRTP